MCDRRRKPPMILKDSWVVNLKQIKSRLKVLQMKKVKDYSQEAQELLAKLKQEEALNKQRVENLMSYAMYHLKEFVEAYEELTTSKTAVATLKFKMDYPDNDCGDEDGDC